MKKLMLFQTQEKCETFSNAYKNKGIIFKQHFEVPKSLKIKLLTTVTYGEWVAEEAIFTLYFTHFSELLEIQI